jgi:lipopolysaccharide transport system permease protein
MSDRITIIESRPAKQSVRELFEFRDLTRNLILSSALQPYADTKLGYYWAVLRPFFFVYVMVFIKNISNPNMGEELPYPLFLYSGLILWWYFVDAIKQATKSLQSHRGLITKVYFPLIIVPVSAVVGRLFDLMLQIGGVLLMMVIYNVYPGAKTVPLLVLVVFHSVILALGFGLFFSILSIYFKDIERILDFSFYLGLFLSPVIYSSSIIPERIEDLYYWVNPFAGPLMYFRSALFSNVIIEWPIVFRSSILAVFVFTVGVFFFIKLQKRIGERL